MKRFLLPLLVLIIMAVGCTKTNDPVDAQPKTVSDVLTETASFSLLKAAIQQAGLNDALKAANLTVFAPTDDAFKAKGFSTPESFKTLTPDALRNLLRYHLVSGIITTKTPELASASNLPVETSTTSALFLTNTATGLFVNGSRVTKADQVAANGVIHTIGTLLSAPSGDALTTLKTRADAGLLVAAITRAAVARPDLLAILNGSTTNATYKTLTLFAPTDAAFSAAGYRTATDINAAAPATLANLLSYHVVSGLIFSNQFQTSQLSTFNSSTNNKVTIAVPASGPTVKGNSNTTAATIKEADILSKNAVIHMIDQVLQP
ncbi:fasciclin domain-containing protein [Fibrella forsythiae]|uniref:Fasciclin domain-containing protein n=1 Tax=Fibrella forsythiae TaxID=2817061 RepID=A0ABS3JNN6_9BACT|nr:fasciclin domain-containing protein [Fibrella forsythiae]MBO0951626.1 fasciclin domain-containing protein [Fibrella forsythiae]